MLSPSFIQVPILTHRTLHPVYKSNSINHLPTSRSRLRLNPRMTSFQTPTSFPRHWYDATVPDLTIHLSAYNIPNLDPQPISQQPAPLATDYHFIDHAKNTMGLLDLPQSPSTPPDLPQALLDQVRISLSANNPLYHAEPRSHLSRLLETALDFSRLPPNSAALALDASSNLVRISWTGPCGLILIRDNCVIYRTYPHTPPHLAFESAFQLPSSTSLKTPAMQQIHSEFLELEDHDLLIAGSDGLFANLSEKQILAFVRPVPDGPEDTTLAIANHTCLGSWTTDDVDFISYYLAFLAANFATAPNSAPHLPFSFPPSPHVDDITVMCASCSFT